MNSHRALCVGSIILLIVITGCGSGGSGFDPNNVKVTVSPAAVTVPANGQVTLHATVTGSGTVSGNALTWSFPEQTTSCYWLDTPPTGPCPDGTIQQVTVMDFQTVTYHAPSASGTFHVVAEWTLWGSPVVKDGTSVITVTP
jgi:hypothetical protein